MPSAGEFIRTLILYRDIERRVQCMRCAERYDRVIISLDTESIGMTSLACFAVSASCADAHAG